MRTLAEEPTEIRAIASFSEEKIDKLTSVIMEYGDGKKAAFSCGMVLATDLDRHIDPVSYTHLALIGVNMNLEELQTGMTAVVDGFGGKVTFEPDEELKAQTEARMPDEEEKLKLLQELKGKEKMCIRDRIISQNSGTDSKVWMREEHE